LVARTPGAARKKRWREKRLGGEGRNNGKKGRKIGGWGDGEKPGKPPILNGPSLLFPYLFSGKRV
jgi:hypothetical protein